MNLKVVNKKPFELVIIKENKFRLLCQHYSTSSVHTQLLSERDMRIVRGEQERVSELEEQQKSNEVILSEFSMVKG